MSLLLMLRCDSDYELDFGYSVGIHHGESGHSYIHRDGIDVL